jgi:hypothetical protein
MKSANQQLVEDAVRDGLFIVHSRYRLRNIKENKLYGWGGEPYFGETTTVGVKTIDGYILDRRAVQPWTDDSRFDEYRDDSHFEPALSECTYQPATGTATAVLPVEKTVYRPLANGALSLAADTIFHRRGFLRDNADGKKQGWLVWLTATDSTAAAENLIAYRSEIEFKNGVNAYPIKAAATAQTLLGGVFLTPRIDGVGQITFYLSGIVVEKNGEWQLLRLDSERTAGQAEKEKPATEKRGGLTPINPE